MMVALGLCNCIFVAGIQIFNILTVHQAKSSYNLKGDTFGLCRCSQGFENVERCDSTSHKKKIPILHVDE